ncbi:MAG TPA: 2-succinyl-5-enolpyruvyl-6-hydroxy-3-cyclohexene-1-carboxylic-acid synthase [Baekduia sp.]|nr:2-succinyl-5-enolpyruvyl-6-hydroxy-3-cyclohexene-1-carboxylic-acid synthase [Baekduia sp.]
MSETNDTYLLLRAFADELARCGVRHACTSPGSRSAPLVLTLARETRLRSWSHVDERAAAFFALGIAKATGLPAVIACTSGTAAANYLPAVIEAHEARVPMIVLTADRPPELRDNGAGQAIDQLKLYGDCAKWFFEVGSHRATEERLRWIRTLACRAYATAVAGTPGVVHLNWPLREPLILDDELPDDDTGRPDGAPFVVGSGTGQNGDTKRLSAALRAAQRPVIVAGRIEQPGERLIEAAHALGTPLLADPLSGLRTGPAAIAHYDALLRDARFSDAHAPDLVLRIGDLPTSKPLRQWLAGLSCTQIAVDPHGTWQDPDAVVATRLTADPSQALLAAAGVRADREWLLKWRAADERARQLLANALGDSLSEPVVAGDLATLLPPGGALFVAASMPIRDIETFFPIVDTPPRVLANRGANGIDGTIATAFGVAATGVPTTLLIGDVTLAHDIGALLTASRLELALTIVLIDNAGGGIFDFLAVSGEADVYEEHVATPTGLQIHRVCELFRLDYRPVSTRDDFARAVRRGGSAIVHVRTVRAENVALHRACWAALA